MRKLFGLIMIFTSMSLFAQTISLNEFVKTKCSGLYEDIFVFHQSDSTHSKIWVKDLGEQDTCFFYIRKTEKVQGQYGIKYKNIDTFYSKCGDNISPCIGIDSVWCYTIPEKITYEGLSSRLQFKSTQLFCVDIDSAIIEGRYVKAPLRVYADGRVHLSWRYDTFNHERSKHYDELYVYTKSNGRRYISKKMSPELKKIKKSKKPKWWTMGGSSYTMPHGVYYYSGVVNGKAYSGTIIY